MPKHHVLIANSYRGGVDAAIQITLDRAEGGGASGAPLEEAISWGKIKTRDRLVTLVGDATIIFPLVALAALEVLIRDNSITLHAEYEARAHHV